MKKNIIWSYAMLLLLGLTACEDDEVKDVFTKSPEQRVVDALAETKHILTGSEFGWNVYYLFNNLTSDAYLNVQFKEDNTAVFHYMSPENELESEETHYTLRYTQQVDLVFDLYSVLSSLVGKNIGGDFRFELAGMSDSLLVFTTRNDQSEGAGILRLVKADNANAFQTLLSMQTKVKNDGTKSFYRLLKIDGSDVKCYFYYQVNTLFDWLGEDGEVHSFSTPAIIAENRFDLLEPLKLGGKVIDHFVYHEEEETFYAYEGDRPVGHLEYGDKAFVYPDMFQRMLNDENVLADTTNLILNPFGMSPKAMEIYNELKRYDTPEGESTSHLMFVKIHCAVEQINFIRNVLMQNGNYWVKPTYSEDGIKFDFLGFGQDGFSELYFWSGAKPVLGIFCNGRLSIVYRNGIYYFVRDDDPTIWFAAEPARGVFSE